MTADLVQFLRARLDEDEAEARAAAEKAGSGDWRYQPDDNYVSWIEHDERASPTNRETWWPLVTEAASYVGDTIDREVADHIARHDPARVLREVEAKQRLLDLHAIVHRNIGWRDDDGEVETGEIPVCGSCVPKHTHYLSREIVPEGPCQTLHLLALPYADHPDYQQEWTP